MRCRGQGPYTLLGWGLGTPLVLRVSQLLEAAGHSAICFLLDGDVTRVQHWAAEQQRNPLAVLTALFNDDSSQDVSRVVSMN